MGGRVRLDNSDIAVGDTLYDLEYGVGTVAEITEAGVHIRINSLGRRKLYDSRGIRGGAKRRVLYWQNPIIANPPKDKSKWDMVTAIAKAACDTVGGINEN